VDEVEPTDVADVSPAASANETDRHDVVPFPILVDVLATVETGAVDEESRAAGDRRLDDVGDEPLGEAPGGHASRRRGWVLIVDRRGSELQPVEVE
jgi:hypothetical protein